MDTTKETVSVKCMQIVGENRFKWPQNEDITEYELQEIMSAIPEPMPVTTRHVQIVPTVWKELVEYEL